MSIVVGVDLSAATDDVVAAAAAMARRLDCEVIVVHVAPPEPDFVTYDVGPQHERDWRASDLHKEHAALNEMAEQLRANGVDARPRLMEGITVDRLLEESSRVDAEMIIVGSHGHGLLYEVLVGSVAEGLLRRSQRPVLVVPVRKGRA